MTAVAEFLSVVLNLTKPQRSKCYLGYQAKKAKSTNSVHWNLS